ncbi:hypothetical protein [uncultured Imperialibacter sp.]|uniref:hypothetical protein n=1 Tax=uncultured Imperialibacter sp. TaxID=1672639 RepID=UPI0030D90BDB|tara:strand:- start:1791 stop:3092 length:1302 start_codon:yes stop_codon:yes gene_type:complete
MEYLIAHCRKLIESQLGWGNASLWTSEDFEILSEKIFEKTQVRLSVTTLKRIWGKVKYESSPNVATLNALAQFVGYDNWRQFRQKGGIPVTPPEVTASEGSFNSDRVIGPKKSKKKNGLLLIAPVGVIALVIASFFMMGKEEKKPETPEKKELPKPLFESKKTSDDLPNSVIFHYDVAQYESDNVYIQQNWDPERREKVDEKGNYHTSIYYYPGYFGARLIVDGEVKAIDNVFIKSLGWKAMVDKSPVPVYLHPDEIKGKGWMGISSKVFREKSGATVFNETWATFHNVREFEGMNGTDFVFEASLRNASIVEESVCRNVIVYLLATESAVIIPLSDKGCVSNLGLLTGNRWIDGKTEDLSAFGCDFSQWQTLNVSRTGDKFEVLLNGTSVLTENQSGSIGDIIGIRFAFEGAGQVTEVRLGNANGTVYEETF